MFWQQIPYIAKILQDLGFCLENSVPVALNELKMKAKYLCSFNTLILDLRILKRFIAFFNSGVFQKSKLWDVSKIESHATSFFMAPMVLDFGQNFC